MNPYRVIVLSASLMFAGSALASDTGGARLLFKVSGSFWHTATNATLTVPIDFKDGAASATLTVRGSTYLHVYEGITTNAFTFSLPPADDVAHEDVYELLLVFDNGSEMKARIGLPYGLMAGAFYSASLSYYRSNYQCWNQYNFWYYFIND